MSRTFAIALAAVALLAPSTAHADLDEDLRSATQAIRAWDMPAAEAAVARALEEAPGDAGVLLVAGHLDLMQGRYAEAIETLSQSLATGLEGEAWAQHLLGLAKATWAETKDYTEVRTAGGHFLIRHSASDAAMVPYVEEVLEQAWTGLIPVFGHEPPVPVRVEIYPRVEVLGAVSSLTVDEIKTSGTIALCKYNRLMITSPADLVYGYGWADTLSHEFIHLLITQKSRNKVPIWLHEGLAKYYEGQWRAGHAPALERTSEDLLARALETDSLISFEDMSPSMAKLPSQEATGTAFAEVFTVIDFLRSRRGDEVGKLLVEAMAAGKTDKEAVAEVAGLTWPRFTPTWRRYLETRGLRTLDEDAFDQRLLFKGSDTAADELETIKGDKARKYVWLGDRMRLRERFKAAAKEYRKAIAEVGDRTPLIQAKLGHALLQLDQLEEGATELGKPLELYPGYVLLRLYLGEAHLRLGRYESAATHLEEAIRINPFDPEVHGLLAKVYAALGRADLAAREQRIHALVRAN